jgi:hypothetical protein
MKLCEGSMKGSTKALLRLYQGSIKRSAVRCLEAKGGARLSDEAEPANAAKVAAVD